MGDLLAADFARLLKSQIFHGSIIFCIECVFFESIVSYCYGDFEKGMMDGLLTSNLFVFGIMLSIFIGLFIGTEYSSGTIRNKVIAGNSRAAIYLSNFIVCTVAGFMLQVLNFILIAFVSNVICDPHGETLHTPLVIMEKQFIGLYIIIAYTAMFIMFAMLINSRSAGTTVVTVIAIALLFAGIKIDSQIAQCDPQTIAEAYSDKKSDSDSDSDTENVEEQYLDLYSQGFGQRKKLEGRMLRLYLFLDKALPSAQIQSMTQSFEPPRNAKSYVKYNLASAAIFTVLGMTLYKYKELK